MGAEARSEVEALWADKVPARLAGTATGLVLGGPAGAIVGAGLTPLIEFVLQKGNERHVAGMASVFHDATEALEVTEEDAIAHIAASDARLALAGKTARAALGTLNTAKLRTLSAMLELGLRDDAKLELASLYVDALADLEASHVRVLHELAIRRTHSWVSNESTLHAQEIAKLFPGIAVGLDAITATLTRLGLATAWQDRWSSTDFGLEMYTWIRGEGSGPSTVPPTEWCGWGCDDGATLQAWAERTLGITLSGAASLTGEGSRFGFNERFEVAVIRANRYRWQDLDEDFVDGAGRYLIAVSTSRRVELAATVDAAMKAIPLPGEHKTVPAK